MYLMDVQCEYIMIKSNGINKKQSLWFPLKHYIIAHISVYQKKVSVLNWEYIIVSVLLSLQIA